MALGKTVQATWLHWSLDWSLASSHDLLRNYRGDKGFCHATLKQGLTNAEFVFTKEMSDSSHVNNLHRFRPTDRNGDQRWQSQAVSSTSMLHTCCWLWRIADERGKSQQAWPAIRIDVRVLVENIESINQIASLNQWNTQHWKSEQLSHHCQSRVSNIKTGNDGYVEL